MSAGDITALIAALTALVTAVGTLVKVVTHLNWHAAAQQQPGPYVPPAPPIPPKS